MSELAVWTKAMMRERKDIAIAIAGGFVAGIGGVSLFSASGYLISKTVFAPPLYTLIVLISIVKMLGLLRALSRYAERLYTHRATFSILSRLRTAFFARLVPLAPGIQRTNRSGDLLARIVGDVESLQHYFLRVAYPPLVLVMVFLATIVFTSFYSIWIACLFVLGMLITAFVIPAVVMHGLRSIRGRVRLQRAALSTELTEMLYGFLELKVYGRLEQREQQLLHSSAVLADKQQASGSHLLYGQAIHACMTFFISWSVLVLGGYLISHNLMDGVFLAMLVMAALTVFEEAAAMATLPAYKQDSEHAAQRLVETVQADGKQPLQPAGTLSGLHAPAIECSDVSFQYADEWRPALRDFHLRIPSGSKIAIVGPSGAGKTTVLELLLKLYSPTQGHIRMNNIPLEELDEASIWQSAAVVLQHNHFFRGTIRDNLLLSGTLYTDEALLTVMDHVQLPYKTLDDAVYEKGENLSDGEKQRLALARAMLKGGRLWLLDEPTSSLDVVTEQHIYKQLFEQAADDTLILICHRLNGLETMDQIVVMDQGTIVEAGTFTELMDRQGYFYEMKQIEHQLIGEGG
ncbi:thiol reductant ABC exporter subunit CydC [Paenibacillus sp. 1011MAR3C5]|uniref:thiol reductant ABC exporter subunit CydC n=1 Tax=Paenibacillus sp. 1011MAR3C5 TaxID=1675787 RepID=UPI000E6C7760|nr:thiol reductant ABC exporter subunit CydC [Paenibacillus sp. 1011MAR3C5]RJE87025.1 thiol reductant ABC exporter subunit CydC [Paenibacillus sp. 1011MAR3C5]